MRSINYESDLCIFANRLNVLTQQSQDPRLSARAKAGITKRIDLYHTLLFEAAERKQMAASRMAFLNEGRINLLPEELEGHALAMAHQNPADRMAAERLRKVRAGEYGHPNVAPYHYLGDLHHDAAPPQFKSGENGKYLTRTHNATK